MTAIATDLGYILIRRVLTVLAAVLLVVAHRAEASFMPAFVVISIRHISSPMIALEFCLGVVHDKTASGYALIPILWQYEIIVLDRSRRQ